MEDRNEKIIRLMGELSSLIGEEFSQIHKEMAALRSELEALKQAKGARPEVPVPQEDDSDLPVLEIKIDPIQPLEDYGPGDTPLVGDLFGGMDGILNTAPKDKIYSWETDPVTAPAIRKIDMGDIPLGLLMLYNKELYNGKDYVFSKELQELDALESFQKVKKRLMELHPEWDFDNATVYKLMMWLRRKFVS